MFVDQKLLGTRHGWTSPTQERRLNVPNAVTLVRTVGATVLGVLALLEPSVGLLVAGYAVYWIGDILDGFLARLLDCETRFGAVGDVLCDRVCTVILAMALMRGWPELAPAVLIFLVQFTLVDLVLSLSFLHWPLLSPNYFFLVDRSVFRWNWSKAAKALNSAGVLLLAVLAGSVVLAVMAAIAGTLVKVISCLRVGLLWDRAPHARGRVSGGAEVALSDGRCPPTGVRLRPAA